MRRSHANPQPDPEFGPEDHTPSSKTQRKEAMQVLQALGERLTGLSSDQLKRVPMPEVLRDAIKDARRFTKHEAIRRQQQYIGRLMRDIDPEPIEAMLAVFDGVSASENARMHRLEKQRQQLLDDENVITEILHQHPHADGQRLRQLRRNAIREKEQNKPPKSFREIFQILKELEGGSSGDAASFSRDGAAEPADE